MHNWNEVIGRAVRGCAIAVLIGNAGGVHAQQLFKCPDQNGHVVIKSTTCDPIPVGRGRDVGTAQSASTRGGSPEFDQWAKWMLHDAHFRFLDAEHISVALKDATLLQSNVPYPDISGLIASSYLGLVPSANKVMVEVFTNNAKTEESEVVKRQIVKCHRANGQMFWVNKPCDNSAVLRLLPVPLTEEMKSCDDVFRAADRMIGRNIKDILEVCKTEYGQDLEKANETVVFPRFSGHCLSPF